MPHPIDPSPYRTIAAALADARRNAPPSAPLSTRTRSALRQHLDQHRASERSLAARDDRMRKAGANRYTDIHNDYATSHPHVAPGFTTKR